MAQNFIQDGERYEHVSAGAIASGSLVSVGDMVGVALGAATGSGETVVLALEGVFELNKATGGGTALTAGAPVYKDGSNNRVTATATANKAVGRVWKAATTTDATVQVVLLPLPAGPLT